MFKCSSEMELGGGAQLMIYIYIFDNIKILKNRWDILCLHDFVVVMLHLLGYP